MPDDLINPDRETLIKNLDRANRYATFKSSESAWEYLKHVVIDSRPEPRLFREVAEPWQWTLLSRIIPALEAVAGVRKEPYNGPRSFWFTLPRGHDKSSSIGRMVNWVLAFSKKQIRGIVGAADKEQAGYIQEFMQAEVNLNPWLKKRIQFKNWQVVSENQSRLKILSADDKSSFGLKEDLMILDELTHWPKEGLFNTVMTGRHKRPGSVLIIITNAGLHRTWQRNVFEEAKKSPLWYVYEAPGNLAQWMDKEERDASMRMVPPGLAKRLYLNQWVDESEDCGFVTREEAEACIVKHLQMRSSGIQVHTPYVAAIDYGPVRDRTVMCVGHNNKDGQVVLDQMKVIQGSRERRVPIEAVERWIDEIAVKFYKPKLIIDPYSMESSIQRYEGSMDIERFESRGGKANYELAANLRNLIINKNLVIYPGAGEMLVENKKEDLIDELAQIHIQQMSYGFRIQHTASEHDDKVIALGMMALGLVQVKQQTQFIMSDRFF